MKTMVVLLMCLAWATEAGAFHARLRLSRAGVGKVEAALEEAAQAKLCVPISLADVAFPGGHSNGGRFRATTLGRLRMEPHASPSEIHIGLAGLAMEGRTEIYAEEAATSEPFRMLLRNGSAWLDVHLGRDGLRMEECKASFDLRFLDAKAKRFRGLSTEELKVVLEEKLRRGLCRKLSNAVANVSQSFYDAPQPSDGMLDWARVERPKLEESSLAVELEGLRAGSAGAEKESNLGGGWLSGEGRRELSILFSQAASGAWLFAKAKAALNGSIGCGGCPLGVEMNGAIIAARWVRAGHLLFEFRSRAYVQDEEGRFQVLGDGNYTGKATFVPRGSEDSITFGVAVTDMEGSFVSLRPELATNFQPNQFRLRKSISFHIHGSLSDALEREPLRLRLPSAFSIRPGATAEWTSEGALLYAADFDLLTPSRLLDQLRRQSFYDAMEANASPACARLLSSTGPLL